MLANNIHNLKLDCFVGNILKDSVSGAMSSRADLEAIAKAGRRAEEELKWSSSWSSSSWRDYPSWDSHGDESYKKYGYESWNKKREREPDDDGRDSVQLSPAVQKLIQDAFDRGKSEADTMAARPKSPAPHGASQEGPPQKKPRNSMGVPIGAAPAGATTTALKKNNKSLVATPKARKPKPPNHPPTLRGSVASAACGDGGGAGEDVAEDFEDDGGEVEDAAAFEEQPCVQEADAEAEKQNLEEDPIFQDMLQRLEDAKTAVKEIRNEIRVYQGKDAIETEEYYRQPTSGVTQKAHEIIKMIYAEDIDGVIDFVFSKEGVVLHKQMFNRMERYKKENKKKQYWKSGWR